MIWYNWAEIVPHTVVDNTAFLWMVESVLSDIYSRLSQIEGETHLKFRGGGGSFESVGTTLPM